MAKERVFSRFYSTEDPATSALQALGCYPRSAEVLALVEAWVRYKLAYRSADCNVRSKLLLLVGKRHRHNDTPRLAASSLISTLNVGLIVYYLCS